MQCSFFLFSVKFTEGTLSLGSCYTQTVGGTHPLLLMQSAVSVYTLGGVGV